MFGFQIDVFSKCLETCVYFFFVVLVLDGNFQRFIQVYFFSIPLNREREEKKRIYDHSPLSER